MFQKALTQEQRNRRALLDNRAWLDEHFKDVQKEYSDMWVAVLDGKIAYHDREVEVIEQKVKGREQEAVIIRIPSDPITRPM